jgi:hypothetical protein
MLADVGMSAVPGSGPSTWLGTPPESGTLWTSRCSVRWKYTLPSSA